MDQPVAEPIRVIVPVEQASAFGVITPCEYVFDLRKSTVNDTPCDCGESEHTRWDIHLVKVHADFLSRGDSIVAIIDDHIFERALAQAEMIDAGPYRS